jgi:hypothetical protein
MDIAKPLLSTNGSMVSGSAQQQRGGLVGGWMDGCMRQDSSDPEGDADERMRANYDVFALATH